jgi:hypothetical protein
MLVLRALAAALAVGMATPARTRRHHMTFPHATDSLRRQLRRMAALRYR